MILKRTCCGHDFLSLSAAQALLVILNFQPSQDPNPPVQPGAYNVAHLLDYQCFGESEQVSLGTGLDPEIQLGPHCMGGCFLVIRV